MALLFRYYRKRLNPTRNILLKDITEETEISRQRESAILDQEIDSTDHIHDKNSKKPLSLPVYNAMRLNRNVAYSSPTSPPPKEPVDALLLKSSVASGSYAYIFHTKIDKKDECVIPYAVSKLHAQCINDEN